MLIDSYTLKLPKKYYVGGRLIFYEGLHLPDFCVSPGSDTQTSYSNSTQLSAFYPLCELSTISTDGFFLWSIFSESYGPTCLPITPEYLS